MAEQNTTQSQHNPFNPFAGVANLGAPFTQVLEENAKRMESLTKEYAAFEQKSVEQFRAMVDESAKLMKESLDYSLKLSAEWRKLALEATKRSYENAAPKA